MGFADRGGAEEAAAQFRRVETAEWSKAPSTCRDLDRRAEPREIRKMRLKAAPDQPSGNAHRLPAMPAGSCAPARFRGLMVL